GDLNEIPAGFSRFADTLLISLLVLLVPVLVVSVLWLPAILGQLGLAGLVGMAGESSEGAAGLFGALSGLGFVLSCLVSLVVLIVFPVFVGTFLVFAFPLVMFRGHSAVGAIRASIAAVKPRFLGFLGLMVGAWVLMVLASSIGSLAGGIGAIVTTPLALGFITTVQLLAFRDFFGLEAGDLDPYARGS
ncbi:MAG: hypothetical protein MI919_43515, partial [Holophagales bacterium]|nr:hypothetical protein [Holophagales bacterium]